MSAKAPTSLIVLSVAIIGAAAGAYWFSVHKPSSEPAPVAQFSMDATPPGITLQPIGKGRGKGYGYADANGLLAYIYDKDAVGQSNCVADCMKGWTPLMPASDARPSGNWSIISRADGVRQWTVKGKPLYRFAEDTTIGDNKGDGFQQVWHAAQFQPTADIRLPVGFAIQEVADAGGQLLVDPRGMTLYAFDGDANQDKMVCTSGQCAERWIPVETGQLSNPIGEWTVVSRNDGVQQWAFKGRPLYYYSGDLQAGDANGIGVDKRWQVAEVLRYAQPKEASIRKALGHGAILATADGMTLYRRDRYLFASGGGRGTHPDTMPMSSMIGRAIGTKGCDAECLKLWPPFKAPPDAQPSGFWQVAIRDDGTRQWVYQGYALYTYAGDKKAGDVNGNGIYDILVKDDGVNRIDDFGTSEGHAPDFGANMPTLYWAYAFP